MCERCRGNGAEPGTPIRTCETCGGAGRVQQVRRTAFGQLVQTRRLPDLRGRGPGRRAAVRALRRRRARAPRPDLGRRGPGGDRVGTADPHRRRRARGRGRRPAGDLYVLVTVAEDERFERRGQDLVTVARVPATLAMVGGTVTVADARRRARGRDPGRLAAGRRDHAQGPRPAAPARRGRPRRPARAGRRRGAEQAEPQAARARSPPPRVARRQGVIRLAVRCRPELAERVLAELLELVPGGVEEERGGEWVEYAIYGPPGELPALPTSRRPRARAWSRSARPRSPTTGRIAGATSTSRSRSPAGGSSSTFLGADPAPRGRGRHRRIDPGQAFGTGAHATTRLCLELLLELADAGARRGPLVDLGTGSGVLAIAAAKLGWAPVIGCDSEPAAVDAAAANAAANGVELELRRLNLREEPPPAAPTVVANLPRRCSTVAARIDDAAADAGLLGSARRPRSSGSTRRSPRPGSRSPSVRRRGRLGGAARFRPPAGLGWRHADACRHLLRRRRLAARRARWWSPSA